jgi:cellulose 1,4-beta-cellobiosidase
MRIWKYCSKINDSVCKRWFILSEFGEIFKFIDRYTDYSQCLPGSNGASCWRNDSYHYDNGRIKRICHDDCLSSGLRQSYGRQKLLRQLYYASEILNLAVLSMSAARSAAWAAKATEVVKIGAFV